MKRFSEHLAEREKQNSYQSTKLWTPRPHLLGMIGEKALADYFGAPQDLSNKPAGDDGIDIWLELRTRRGSSWFAADAKCSSYGDWLRVDTEIIKPETIYVLVYAKDGQGECIGWEWGMSLMRIDTINWCGNGALVHAKKIPLRKMGDLLDRYIGYRHHRVI